MNDERRQILERLFDGEAVADDPRDAADDPEAQAYLRRLGLLRALARRHDPAAATPSRHRAVVPPRRRVRTFSTSLALAAGLLLMAVGARYGLRAGREPASIPVAIPKSSAHAEVAVDATVRQRSFHPSCEVDLYRWANAAAPRREDVARIALSRVEGKHRPRASREVLALKLANSTTGSVPMLARSVSSHAAGTSGRSRRAAPANRQRSLTSPRA